MIMEVSLLFLHYWQATICQDTRKACAAFKIFLNIKVTSLPKYKEETLQCSDKRRLGHESPALGGSLTVLDKSQIRAAAEGNAQMHFILLYYYYGFKRHTRGKFFFSQSVTHFSICECPTVLTSEIKIKTATVQTHSATAFVYELL